MGTFALMLPLSLVEPIEKLLTKHVQQQGLITQTNSVAGGSINEACRLQYEGVSYFVKWNKASAFPGMFQDERDGLDELRHAKSIEIPEVIGTGESGSTAFILMEYVEPSRPTAGFWESFGRGLAKLHQTSQPKFGYHRSNYIGSLRQSNQLHDDWVSFFRDERLAPQLKTAEQKGLVSIGLMKKFDKLLHRLESLLPAESPSLLHGDLWSGNFLCSNNQQAVLIDPSVYYGFREMDLAMTMLFGGFDAAFYHAYHEAFPLEKNWKSRTDLCNLYPLLVHVNLFGSGYVHQLDHAVSKYL